MREKQLFLQELELPVHRKKIPSDLAFSHIIFPIGNIKLIQESVCEYLGACIFLPLHSDSV